MEDTFYRSNFTLNTTFNILIFKRSVWCLMVLVHVSQFWSNNGSLRGELWAIVRYIGPVNLNPRPEKTWSMVRSKMRLMGRYSNINYEDVSQLRWELPVVWAALGTHSHTLLVIQAHCGNIFPLFFHQEVPYTYTIPPGIYSTSWWEFLPPVMSVWVTPSVCYFELSKLLYNKLCKMCFVLFRFINIWQWLVNINIFPGKTVPQLVSAVTYVN